MNTAFYKPEHDVAKFTGTHRSAVSQTSYESALFASAYLTNFGTAYFQNDGRPPIVMARVGNTALVEQSNIWCIVGIPKHIIAYGENEWSKLLPNLTLSGTGR